MRSHSKTPQLTWENAPDILTVEEAARLARIPRNAAYEAVRRGLIPSANFGSRRIRIAKVALAKVFGSGVEARLRLVPSNELEAM